MKILLLRPVPGNERFGLGPFFRIEPLGMEYIASALETQGHRVVLADLRFSASLESQMRSLRPDLVGIAAMHALETDDVLALARRVRAQAPGVPAVDDRPRAGADRSCGWRNHAHRRRHRRVPA